MILGDVMAKKYFCPRAEAKEAEGNEIGAKRKYLEATYNEALDEMNGISARLDGLISNMRDYDEVEKTIRRISITVAYVGSLDLEKEVKMLNATAEKSGITIPEKQKIVTDTMESVRKKFKKLAESVGLSVEKLEEEYATHLYACGTK